MNTLLFALSLFAAPAFADGLVAAPAPTFSFGGIALALAVLVFAVCAVFWYKKKGGAEIVQSAMNRAETEVGNLTRKAEPAAAAPAAAPASSLAPPAATGAPAEQTRAPVDDTMILCPKTGHRVPAPNPGEELLSYYMRVSPNIGGHGLADAGGLALMQSGLHTVNDGTPASWPLLADEYANRDAYLTDAEKAEYAAAHARDVAAAGARVDGAFPVATLTLNDKMYLFRMMQTYKERLGNSRDLWAEAVYGEGQAVRDAINDAESTHAAETQMFDVNGYSGRIKTWVENRMNGA